MPMCQRIGCSRQLKPKDLERAGHKTRKVSFQMAFWFIVLLHQVFWIDQLFLGGHLLTLF